MAHYAFASGLVGQDGDAIGVRELATADELSKHHRVTIITDLALREEMCERYAGNDAVELIYVPFPGPGAPTGYHGRRHLWSMRVYRAIRALCERDAPDLIQFSDYGGEATCTLQARRTGDPLLASTPVAVSLATSWEMADVLDNFIPDELERRATYALEHYSLRYADLLVHSSDAVLETYRSFYGADQLAPAFRYPAFASTADAAPLPPFERRAPDSPLRMLYAGRLEYRKGISDLVRALAFSRLDDWTLTICGADTPTASLGASMREVLGDAADGDARIEFVPRRDHGELMKLIDEHDVLISPSPWESGPMVALEALARNRPVLATPAGGHLDFAIEGQSGMLAEGIGPEALAALVERAVRQRESLRELSARGAPRQRFDELTDAATFEQQFADAAAFTAPDKPTSRDPLVTVVIPYFEMSEFVESTLESVLAQTYPNIETLIVRDGSFAPGDAVLDRLAEHPRVRVLSKLNGGVGSARNFGALHADGKYVMILDADNQLHPEFVDRAVRGFELDPETAYITSILKLINPDGTPHAEYPVSAMIGNFPAYVEEKNCCGDAMAMVRRSVFDAGHRYAEDIGTEEDREFYLGLRAAGRFGHAVPEPMLEYRVRGDSMARTLTREGELRMPGELAARRRRRTVRWMT
ncbi:MAG: glycosyltransferase [Thermoleophilaceae bacterium]|nr:glycosyltransferase [Thermoleophilaceae bacterium]